MAFEASVTKKNLWCTSCHNFAMKLSAYDAAVQSTFSRIAEVSSLYARDPYSNARC